MLKLIQEALRERKTNDKGFSLVELAVVIVIIGILVAIAVPVFAGIQNSAKDANIKAAAANGSAIVASVIAGGGTAVVADLAGLVEGPVTAVTVTNGGNLATYCVTATGDGADASKGPGC